MDDMPRAGGVAIEFALFGTDLGVCSIAWGPGGICAVQLPQQSELAMRGRMRRQFALAHEMVPPMEVQQAINGVVALLRGERIDLSGIALDMTGVPPFHQRVYAVARAIPVGATLTYGEVAAQLGEPGAARAVGQALGANPFAPVVPCHRVMAAGGKAGGFSATGGIKTKLQLLLLEGATFGEPGLF
jgi:methylated-DNA-[protein]-cysteine S-methyltransferase